MECHAGVRSLWLAGSVYLSGVSIGIFPTGAIVTGGAVTGRGGWDRASRGSLSSRVPLRGSGDGGHHMLDVVCSMKAEDLMTGF